MEVTIREYLATDRPAIRRICFETGLMGDPIASQYADEESFADIFTAYYTDHEPQNVFVAEKSGKVVGYAFGALDTRKAYGALPYMLEHVLLRGVCLRPGTAHFCLRTFVDSMADVTSRSRKPKIDLDRYPSDAHINLLPEVRRSGLGFDLYSTMLDRLRERGSCGMHADVLAANQVVIDWFNQKFGGRKVGEPYPMPGMRGPQGERMQLQCVVLGLRDYIPGAWKQRKTKTAVAAK